MHNYCMLFLFPLLFLASFLLFCCWCGCRFCSPFFSLRSRPGPLYWHPYSRLACCDGCHVHGPACSSSFVVLPARPCPSSASLLAWPPRPLRPPPPVCLSPPCLARLSVPVPVVCLPPLPVCPSSLCLARLSAPPVPASPRSPGRVRARRPPSCLLGRPFPSLPPAPVSPPCLARLSALCSVVVLSFILVSFCCAALEFRQS